MKSQQRNLGIELLRIICMLCVIMQHIIGHGWVIQSLHPGTWKYDLVVALRSVCLCGISCFALVSGYVGVCARYRYSSIVLQWTKVWLYAIFFTGLICVLIPGSVSRSDWMTALFPALSRMYWYFTAYLACAVIAPIIRMAVRRMTLKQGTVCILTLIFLFSLLGNSFGRDVFYADRGQGTLWLVVLYAIGAYFGWFQPHTHISKAILWSFAMLATLVMAGLQPVAARMGIASLSMDPQNNSIQTLMLAISMLLLFSRMDIRYGKTLISWLGGASFSVYVIHDHPLVRRYTISSYSYLLTLLGNVQILIGIVLTSMAVYLICALIDSLRERLYVRLRVRQRLQALELKLIGDLWAD